jgi:hypothetical protein
MQRETIEEQVQKLLAGMDEQNEQEQETGTIENEAADGKQYIYVLLSASGKKRKIKRWLLAAPLFLLRKYHSYPCTRSVACISFVFFPALRFRCMES